MLAASVVENIAVITIVCDGQLVGVCATAIRSQVPAAGAFTDKLSVVSFVTLALVNETPRGLAGRVGWAPADPYHKFSVALAAPKVTFTVAPVQPPPVTAAGLVGLTV